MAVAVSVFFYELVGLSYAQLLAPQKVSQCHIGYFMKIQFAQISIFNISQTLEALNVPSSFQSACGSTLVQHTQVQLSYQRLAYWPRSLQNTSAIQCFSWSHQKPLTVGAVPTPSVSENASFLCPLVPYPDSNLSGTTGLPSGTARGG